MYTVVPEQMLGFPVIVNIGVTGVNNDTLVVLVVTALLPDGSSQLLSLVALVPPPVHDKSKRP